MAEYVERFRNSRRSERLYATYEGALSDGHDQGLEDFWVEKVYVRSDVAQHPYESLKAFSDSVLEENPSHIDPVGDDEEALVDELDSEVEEDLEVTEVNSPAGDAEEQAEEQTADGGRTVTEDDFAEGNPLVDDSGSDDTLDDDGHIVVHNDEYDGEHNTDGNPEDCPCGPQVLTAEEAAAMNAGSQEPEAPPES